MRITLATVGTRGDVQPYIAVAHELRARGHDVVIATHDEFKPMVAEHRFEHRTMRGNFRDMMQTELGRAWLNSGDSPRHYAKYAKELFVPLQRGWCEDADAACEGSDAVVFYVMALHIAQAAERRKLPAVVVSPWAIQPTRDFVAVGPPWLDSALPGFAKLWFNHQVLKLAFSPFNEPIQEHRLAVGLPRSLATDPFHHVLAAKIPSVHLFSESVIPRPRDWERHHAVAGFAFLPDRPYTPPASLVDFLASGTTPIYLGFGSMTGFDPEQLAELATRAARLAGVRAIVASGWAGLQPRRTDDVYVIDEVPHEWLFPRVAAVVHHGGVGTFAAGLRAGKPTVIAAFFGDQPFWGRTNEKLGTGPRALARASITAENLAVAIRKAVSDSAYRVRAEAIGERLRSEGGAARAAEMIEERLLLRG